MASVMMMSTMMVAVMSVSVPTMSTAAPVPMPVSMAVFMTMVMLVTVSVGFQGGFVTLGLPALDQFGQKRGKLRLFGFIQWCEPGGCIIAPGLRILRDDGAPLVRQGQDDVAFVLFVLFANDVAVSFQLDQQLAEGSGANLQAFHQFPLADGIPGIDDCQDMALSGVSGAFVMMASPDQAEGAVKEVRQVFGGSQFGHVHFLSLLIAFLRAAVGFAATTVRLRQGAVVAA